MKIGIGLPNQGRETRPTVIPGLAARAEGTAAGPTWVEDTVADFAAIGAGELIFNPTAGDPDEITWLADTVLCR
jgi:hypothetical protein